MAGGLGFLGRVARAGRPSKASSGAAEIADQKGSPFGKFGERGETLVEQVASFSRRMDEVVNMRDEFSLVAKPMVEFIASHAAAQTRLSELTALLARERSDSKALRSDLGDLRTFVAEQENLLAAARSQVQALEASATARDAELKRAQVAAADLTSRLDWANREAAAQAHVARDREAAHRALVEEKATLEQAFTEATGILTQLRDQTGAHEAEILRLTQLVDQLQPQLAIAKRKIADLGADLHSATLTISSQELKIAGEQEARRKAEIAHAESITVADGEMARLSNDIESLKTKHDATKRLFEQSRELVAEKTEAARVSDRVAKEALAERIALERRFASALEEARHLKDRIDSTTRAADESRERAIMLANALAAKDRQIEQLQNRVETTASQLQETAARFDRERMDLQADNRRLIEENQTEKAERALAQGALRISRASRDKLLQQLDELKRSRGFATDQIDGAKGAADDPDAASNVRRFHATEMED